MNSYDEYVIEVMRRAVEFVNSSTKWDGFDLKKDGDGGRVRMLRFYELKERNERRYSVPIVIMNGRVVSSDMNLETIFNKKVTVGKV